MAFDPTLPAANSLIASGELRDQFNGLKELIEERPTVAQVNASTAANPADVQPIPWTSSADPPTAEDLDGVIAKINELIGALKRA